MKELDLFCFVLIGFVFSYFVFICFSSEYCYALPCYVCQVNLSSGSDVPSTGTVICNYFPEK